MPLFGLLFIIFPLVLFAKDLTIVELENSIEVLLKRNGDYCLITTNTNSILKTDCLRLINSKGKKIICTKRKKVCKTEKEIIEFISINLGAIKSDEYYNNEGSNSTNEKNSEVKINNSLCMLSDSNKNQIQLMFSKFTYDEFIQNKKVNSEGKKSIVTLQDARGTDIVDIILYQTDFKDKKTCYFIDKIYI